MTASIEKRFATDMLSKRGRVERTLNHQEVDRCALHEQLSYNPKNFRAMVEAVGECRNADFSRNGRPGTRRDAPGRIADERGESTSGLPAPLRELP